MDGSRFDALLRALATTPSRRGVARLLAGTALGGFLVGEATPTDPKKKKKVTLCLNGQTLKASKKAKKKYLARGVTLGACLSPPSGGCPSGQKPCDGGCIPSGRCCGDADCPVSGQVCTVDRQCACPVALPEICGGACRQACGSGEARNPDTCSCCRRDGELSGGDPANCCSGSVTLIDGTFCTGRMDGSPCTFDAQCKEMRFCINGVCQD